MRAVAVVGSKGKEVTVVERECSASDRLDTRREAEVSVVWGRGTADGEAEETRRGEHPWALLVVLSGCVWQQLLPLLRKWSCNARSRLLPIVLQT